jgi:hypothetical protein
LGRPQAHDSSGRDDKFVARTLSYLYWKRKLALKMNCHLDRSEAEWRDLRVLFLSAKKKPLVSEGLFLNPN